MPTAREQPSIWVVDEWRGGRKVREVWLEVPIAHTAWLAAYRLLVQEGQVVVGEVRVFPNERGARHPGRWSAERLGDEAKAPTGGLQTRTLREAVPVRHVRESLPAILKQMRKRYGSYFTELLTERGFPGAELEQGARVGRVVRDDRFYAERAAAYVEAVGRKGSRTPVADLSKEYHLAESYVRDIIGEARRRGLLTSSAPGKAGGSLTPKARKILGMGEGKGRKKR